MSTIFAHKRPYASFLHEVFRNPSCCNPRLINANSLYCSLRRAALWLHQVVRNIQTTRNRPNKPVCEVTFAPRFCVVSRWLPANKSVIFDYLSDPGLHRIPCYALLHRTEVLSFNCGLSVAKYQHQLSAVKNNSISIGPKKPYSVELFLESNQTWLVVLVV